MNDQVSPNLLKPFAPGLILALLAILMGFGLGGAFGAAEDSIKGYLKESTEPVMDSVYKGSVRKRNAVVNKSWSYLKRAHMHGGAIGTAALGCILVLALTGRAGLIEKTTAMAFGTGAILYSAFWLLAAIKAPVLGSTGDAKDALKIIAVPGAAFCILGLLGTLFSVIRNVLFGAK